MVFYTVLRQLIPVFGMHSKGYFRRTNVMKKGRCLQSAVGSLQLAVFYQQTAPSLKPGIVVGVGAGVNVCIVVA